MRREDRMKYYNKLFLQSFAFYKMFYLPDVCLEHYIIGKNYFEKLGTHEEAIKIVNADYLSHCNRFFKKDIIFYEKLSHYLLNADGTVKPLDDYIFFKLRYYGTKFLNIANEAANFFEEERKKWKENMYDKTLILLSTSKFHKKEAAFYYQNNILQITYGNKDTEEIFEFHNVGNWEKQTFMKQNPTLVIQELYEEPKGIFVYNTVWEHEEIGGKNQSELSITFDKVIQLK